MLYLISLTSYINNQHQYTESYDSGTTDQLFTAETYARSLDNLPAPQDGEELEFAVRIYAENTDSLFDDPIYCDEWRYSHEG